jgi:hypothetical protein
MMHGIFNALSLVIINKKSALLKKIGGVHHVSDAQTVNQWLAISNSCFFAGAVIVPITLIVSMIILKQVCLSTSQILTRRKDP